MLGKTKLNLLVDFCCAGYILNRMVEQLADLDLVFRALGDPTRRAMLSELQGGERSIGELARPFEISLAGAAKHVGVLYKAKLISRRKIGRTHYCKLNQGSLQAAHAWLEQYSKFWNQRLDKLEELLADEKHRKSTDK